MVRPKFGRRAPQAVHGTDRRIRVEDPATGKPAAPDEPGQLWVLGTPGVDLFAGYLDDETMTARVFRQTPDGTWFATGDLVTSDPDGTLRFVGRIDDVIKVSGENVSHAQPHPGGPPPRVAPARRAAPQQRRQGSPLPAAQLTVQTPGDEKSQGFAISDLTVTMTSGDPIRSRRSDGVVGQDSARVHAGEAAADSRSCFSAQQAKEP